MAVGKYAEWLTPEGLAQLKAWAEMGLTDDQMIHNMGITTSTFYVWCQKYPEFKDAIKRGKAVIDLEVENALLKRALGYEVVEEVTEVTGEGDEQRKHIKRTKKEIPPDVAAVIFWLKNRRPDRWRDKVDVDSGVSDDKLAELIKAVKAV